MDDKTEFVHFNPPLSIKLVNEDGEPINAYAALGLYLQRLWELNECYDDLFVCFTVGDRECFEYVCYNPSTDEILFDNDWYEGEQEMAIKYIITVDALKRQVDLLYKGDSEWNTNTHLSS